MFEPVIGDHLSSKTIRDNLLRWDFRVNMFVIYGLANCIHVNSVIANLVV